MGLRVCENAKGDAGILAMDEVDEIVNEFVVPAFGGARFDEGFANAISNDDKERKDEPTKT